MRDGEQPVKPQSIQLTAGKKIDISKGDTLGIEFVDEMYVQGPMIKYEGTIKDDIEIPEEIANEGKNDEKLMNDINSNAKNIAEEKVKEAKSKIFNNIYYNYEYNIEGLLEKKTAYGKTLLEYTYDKNNNIKSIKDITGKSSKYT